MQICKKLWNWKKFHHFFLLLMLEPILVMNQKLIFCDKSIIHIICISVFRFYKFLKPRIQTLFFWKFVKRGFSRMRQSIYFQKLLRLSSNLTRPVTKLYINFLYPWMLKVIFKHKFNTFTARGIFYNSLCPKFSPKSVFKNQSMIKILESLKKKTHSTENIRYKMSW